jgi:hypothetical protein
MSTVQKPTIFDWFFVEVEKIRVITLKYVIFGHWEGIWILNISSLATTSLAMPTCHFISE